LRLAWENSETPITKITKANRLEVWLTSSRAPDCKLEALSSNSSPNHQKIWLHKKELEHPASFLRSSERRKGGAETSNKLHTEAQFFKWT
jgi:hypothetical protein